MFRNPCCRIFLSMLLLFPVCLGCESKIATNNEPSFRIPDITCSLGWLGAKAYPLTKAGRIDDPENPDRRLTHGGLTLIEVAPKGEFSKLGLKKNDIIVQVAGQWLPLKENPMQDLMEMIETRITAEQNEITIGYLRQGKFSTTLLKPTRTSLDKNLPAASVQIVRAVETALQKLADGQLEDGSFPAGSDDVQQKLIATSSAGLAFLSAHETYAERFDANVQRCLQFIANQFSDDLPDDMQVITYACVAQFLAESEIELLEENWLDVVSVLNDKFAETQQESGSWSLLSSAVEPEDDQITNDLKSLIIETHTTNQVLLAIGAWERKGFAFDSSLAKRGCAFLDRAGKARISSRMDRRTKAVLSAGSASALLALNCDRGNPQLLRYLEESLSRASDMNSAPVFSLSGLFNCGLVARQLDTPSWLNFHRQTRFLAACLFESDGNVARDPDWQVDLPEFKRLIDSDVWRSAHWIMIASLYWQPLTRMSGIDRTDEIELRDHLANKFEISQPVDDSDSRKKDAEELTRMIIQQLKDRGMDVDEEKLKKNKPEPKTTAEDGE